MAGMARATLCSEWRVGQSPTLRAEKTKDDGNNKDSKTSEPND